MEILRELGYRVIEAHGRSLLRYVLLERNRAWTCCSLTLCLPGGMYGRPGRWRRRAARTSTLKGAVYDRICPQCHCSQRPPGSRRAADHQAVYLRVLVREDSGYVGCARSAAAHLGGGRRGPHSNAVERPARGHGLRSGDRRYCGGSEEQAGAVARSSGRSDRRSWTARRHRRISGTEMLRAVYPALPIVISAAMTKPRCRADSRPSARSSS